MQHEVDDNAFNDLDSLTGSAGNPRFSSSGTARPNRAARRRQHPIPGATIGDGVRQGLASQASTLAWFSPTHFSAAASGSMPSSEMYLATTFWSSLVHLNALTSL